MRNSDVLGSRPQVKRGPAKRSRIAIAFEKPSACEASSVGKLKSGLIEDERVPRRIRTHAYADFLGAAQERFQREFLEVV